MQAARQSQHLLFNALPDVQDYQSQRAHESASQRPAPRASSGRPRWRPEPSSLSRASLREHQGFDQANSTIDESPSSPVPGCLGTGTRRHGGDRCLAARLRRRPFPLERRFRHESSGWSFGRNRCEEAKNIAGISSQQEHRCRFLRGPMTYSRSRMGDIGQLQGGFRPYCRLTPF